MGLVNSNDIDMAANDYIYKSVDGMGHTLPDEHIMQFVTKDFDKHGNREAIVDGISGRSYTYTQLKALYTKCGSALIRKGFRQGDVLCIYSPNLPEYQIIVGAVLSVGGIVTTANPLSTVEELTKQLQNAKPSFIVTTPEFTANAKQVKRQVASIKDIIVFGESVGCTSFADLARDDGNAFPTHVQINPNDIAYLLYSSGTTGLPKGVMLTHRNAIANVFLTVKSRNAMPFTPYEDCALAVLPFFHVYGCVTIAMTCLRGGVKLVTLPRFVPESFLQALQEHKITIGFLVPPLVVFLAKNPMVDKYDLSSLQDVFAGAAPLGGELVTALKKRINLPFVRQGYGLTEVCSILTCGKRGISSPASAGFLICNTEGKIIDPESGRSLPPGGRGELWVRGPQIMKGYLNNPKATANCIDKEGWFQTGDIGYFDDDGQLYIVDRLKELIKYKGSQVAPAELEALLLTNHAVADAAVIGVPDEEAGELPKAFVILKETEQVTEVDIANFVAGRVAPHKRLRGGVEIVEMIPKSASGKILRRQLRDQERQKRAKTKKFQSKL